MRLIDPYTGFREGCEIALETGSLLNLDVGNFAVSVPRVEGMLYMDISLNVSNDISSNITI
jgi:hypothetical protein